MNHKNRNDMKEILGERCYTAQETADMLGISRWTVYARYKAGGIRGALIGRRLYFAETEIRAFLRGGNVKTEDKR